MGELHTHTRARARTHTHTLLNTVPDLTHVVAALNGNLQKQTKHNDSWRKSHNTNCQLYNRMAHVGYEALAP